MKGIGSHIVLVGFMGSGKTTIGKLLAEALDMDFIDMDTYIEDQENMTINDIFADKGEAYFRQKESEALSDILSQKNAVILSTGGGAPCYFNNMKHINARSMSIYLKVGSKKLVDRLKNDKLRPLLKNKTAGELLLFVRAKLRDREADYMLADIRIRGIGSPEKITKRLLKYILKTSL